MAQQIGTKRLYKSRTERMIDGVCGGIAQYFDLDPTLVRIAWVLLTLVGGSGILLYIVAMIIMPKEPFVGGSPTSGQATVPEQPSSTHRNSFFWGILLILVGLYLFFEKLGWTFWRPWWWLNAEVVLPVMLILAGVAFLWGGRNSLATSPAPEGAPEGQPHGEPTQRPDSRRLYRSVVDRRLFGVCGGLAEYFGVDSTIVRILVVIAALASAGVVLLAYVIMAIILPRQAPTLRMS